MITSIYITHCKKLDVNLLFYQVNLNNKTIYKPDTIP